MKLPRRTHPAPQDNMDRVADAMALIIELTRQLPTVNTDATMQTHESRRNRSRKHARTAR